MARPKKETQVNTPSSEVYGQLAPDTEETVKEVAEPITLIEPTNLLSIVCLVHPVYNGPTANSVWTDREAKLEFLGHSIKFTHLKTGVETYTPISNVRYYRF